MTQQTILIADDEKNTREGLRWALEKEGRTILLAADGAEALDAIRGQPVDLAISDLRMPRLDGMALLEKVRAESPDTAVVILTGHGTVESAVDAMKHGAFDYLIKPVNIDELNIVVERCFSTRELERENISLKEQLGRQTGFDSMVGRGAAMTQVFNKVKTVAPTRATVLITGESGTGKELVANAIHQHSPRRHRAFVKVNCGALPLTLLESELFGHEKGAFTGAIKMRQGRFEQADGGTLLLDEIGETGPEFQVKLLRVLQEGTFERVGGSDTIKVDVRVLAATNRRLEEMVAAGTFREDLYYRLKVVEITLPPLRQRREDIPLLVDRFLEEFSAYYGKPRPQVQPKALAALQGFDWPGNIRQLRNLLEGTFVLTEGTVTLASLPEEFRAGHKDEGANTVQIPVSATIADAEKAMIQAALIHYGGNKAETARSLGLGRKTLYRKLEELGLE